MHIAKCNYVRVTSPNAPSSADPTLEVAERQLAMLRELAQMALVTCRAHAAADVAAAHAVEAILADEFWVPETGRARALAGAKDTADAFQKVSRALRLTLKLEMAAAETVRDIRAGIITHTTPSKNAGEDPGLEAGTGSGAPADGAECFRRNSDPADREADATRSETDTERLADVERPDILPRTPFRQTVDRICADLNGTVDWTSWKVGPPNLEYQGLQPKPPGWSECRPPDAAARWVKVEPGDPDSAFSP